VGGRVVECVCVRGVTHAETGRRGPRVAVHAVDGGLCARREKRDEGAEAAESECVSDPCSSGAHY
jgi:hypothetical protein